MPSTFSPALRLELIGNGEQAANWGNTTNTNLGTLLEQAITGVASITMLDANYTLVSGNGVSDEARNAVLIMSGTLSATRSVIVPTSNKFYAVRNATTGSQSILIRTSGGTGVTLANGFTQLMYCDGTNVVAATVAFNAATNTVSVNVVGNLTGNVTGNLTGNVTGNVSGTAANVTGIVAIANGGTGATTQGAARTALGSTAVGDAVFTAVNAAAARTATGSAASGAVGSSDITMNTSRLLGRTTAGSGAIEEISVGTGLSLTGGVLSSPPSSFNGLLLNVQAFTSSGTYTRTAGVSRAVVVAVGGGGGGGGATGGTGGTGGTTSFGSYVTAVGGSGGGGNFGVNGNGGTGGTGATIAIRGSVGLGVSGAGTLYSGAGGGQGGGIGVLVPGSTGAGTNGTAGVRGGGGGGATYRASASCCGTTPYAGAGGGQGETAIDYITSVGATETVTIGAGGTGGVGTNTGGVGGPGYVIVYEYS